MDFGKLYVPCVVSILLLISGCSESGQFVDYSTLDAAEPDFVSNGTSDFSGGVVAELNKAAPSDTSKDEVVTEPDDAGKPSKATQETPESGIANQEATADETTGEEPQTATSDGDDSADAAAVDPLNPDQEESTEPRQIELLVKDKRFRSEDDSLRVSYDDIDLLKVLNMEPVPVDAPKHFPEWLTALDGKRIRIRGFMYPTFEAKGLKGFTLARDNGICCFVRQPMIYDIIGVDMADGTTTNYIDNKPFDVEGVFQIVPEADDTELFQLYRIADAKVLN